MVIRGTYSATYTFDDRRGLGRRFDGVGGLSAGVRFPLQQLLSIIKNYYIFSFLNILLNCFILLHDLPFQFLRIQYQFDPESIQIIYCWYRFIAVVKDRPKGPNTGGVRTCIFKISV